ncbi:MAG: hypothetical protein ACRDNS_07510 [Trebonia sp.]
MQVVALLQLTFVAALAPKAMPVAPAVVLKFVPVTVTSVPPLASPPVGLMALTLGAPEPQLESGVPPTITMMPLTLAPG